MQTQTVKHSSGFTLIEVMVVVAIIGILVSIAMPSYQSYVRKTNRIDAFESLQAATALQEKFYAVNRRYVASANPFTNESEVDSAKQYYQISVEVDGRQYTITATADSDSSQAQDTGCTVLTLNRSGKKTPIDCWQ